MPRLPPVRGHRAPGAGRGVCQNGEGPGGVHHPAADQHPPQRGGGRRGRHVRRAAGGGAVLADARCAVPAPGRLGQARPAARPADCDCPARRRGPGEAGRLPEWRRGTQGGRGRRAARGTVRCPCHSLLLYRGRPARRGTLYAGSDAARAGLDLRRAHPRDSSPPPAPVSKPSFLYRLSVHVVTRAAPLVARFDKKVARGLDGRRGLAARLAGWAAAQRDAKRPLIWMHAPSVGEGLQAKPVLETLRAEHPDWQLAFTFFSPSAERLAKNLPVDVADYLPLDRASEVTAVLAAPPPTPPVFSQPPPPPHARPPAPPRPSRLLRRRGRPQPPPDHPLPGFALPPRAASPPPPARPPPSVGGGGPPPPSLPPVPDPHRPGGPRSPPAR